MASDTFRKIESFRKPQSRKQLLMRILGGKKEKEGKENPFELALQEADRTFTPASPVTMPPLPVEDAQ